MVRHVGVSSDPRRRDRRGVVPDVAGEAKERVRDCALRGGPGAYRPRQALFALSRLFRLDQRVLLGRAQSGHGYVVRSLPERSAALSRRGSHLTGVFVIILVASSKYYSIVIMGNLKDAVDSSRFSAKDPDVEHLPHSGDTPTLKITDSTQRSRTKTQCPPRLAVRERSADRPSC